MAGDTYNVLFLCTGNSARSILAESILNREGSERFRAFSAGSTPTGRVNPHALKLLESRGYPTDGLRSKSWEEFAAEGAASMDLIITVCDNAAGEVCPVWPGKPMQAHWGIEDPAAATGDEAAIDRAFVEAYERMHRRMHQLIALPVETLDAATLKRSVNEIGATDDATSPT
jgi:arsenate reductase